MSALILTPDQARFVVGLCRVCGCRWVNTFDDVCADCDAPWDRVRFIPSDTPDRYQPGEWVDVFAHRVRSDGSLSGLIHVGRVRLGEAWEIGGEDHETYDDRSLAFVDGRLLLTEWTGHPVYEDTDTDITVPHLTLWPEAFTPGTCAHPIIGRSPS